MIKLQIGKEYFLSKKVREGCFVEKIEQKMRLIELYKHHAVFRNEYGYCESFIYTDLRRMLSGTPVNRI